MPIETDYAWAAGFLDGEGCFQAVKRRSGPGHTYNPSLSASQACRQPLERLQEIFGGAICESKTRLRPGESRIWLWQVFSAEALREILPKLIPYMTVKQKEATLLLALCNLIGPKFSRHITPINKARRRQLAVRLVDTRKQRKLEHMP